MPPTATEFSRQFINREFQQFCGRKFFKHLDHVVFRPAETASLAMHGLEFIAQNGGDNSEELAALLEPGLRVGNFKNGLAFHGYTAAGHKNPAGPEIRHNVMEQTDFVAGKQWKQMLKKERKSGEHAFAFIIGMKSTHGMLAGNQNVSGHKPLSRIWKVIFGKASFYKHKGKFVFILGWVNPQF